MPAAVDPAHTAVRPAQAVTLQAFHLPQPERSSPLPEGGAVPKAQCPQRERESWPQAKVQGAKGGSWQEAASGACFHQVRRRRAEGPAATLSRGESRGPGSVDAGLLLE